MDLGTVARIAADGFYDDPVLSWVFPDPDTRLDALVVSFRQFAARFLGRNGRVDLLADGCTAMWLPPDPPEASPDAETPPPPETWHHFTPDVVARFASLSAVMDAAHPDAPHWYLGVVATRPDRQGGGLGARILAPVLELCDRQGVPAYLESSNPRNLPFYYRQGWVETGEIVVPEGPTLFPMWREPRITGRA
ncbi:MAG TPA: GNAT family N-acetyltransferase [Acidimicrobiales bacterium]|nr:GNAT family N-acetyltransferase [Acidimicrobiales bacterium]